MVVRGLWRVKPTAGVGRRARQLLETQAEICASEVWSLPEAGQAVLEDLG